MTLKQMEAFYWIAELGSFTAAAIRLNSTQPALSNRMREFEETIGTKLFEPDIRQRRPTAKGREVLTLCAQVLELSQTLANIAGAAQPMGGLVRVGASDNVALTWLPQLMSELGERYPQIDVDLIVDLSQNLKERLIDRRLDIAFLAGPINELDVSSRPLGYMRNAWMCAPSLLRKLRKKDLDPKEMGAIPIFTALRGMHLHQIIIQWFDTHGVRPARVHGCTSVSTMFRMTVAGLGLAILPVDLMREQVRNKQLKVLLPNVPFPPNLFVVAHQSRTLDSTIQVIADMAVEVSFASGLFHRTLPEPDPA